jgi:uncharacterized protein (TIGR02391 family)
MWRINNWFSARGMQIPKQLYSGLTTFLRDIEALQSAAMQVVDYQSRTRGSATYESLYIATQAVFDTLLEAGIGISNPNPYSHVADFESAFTAAHIKAGSGRDRSTGCRQFLRDMYAQIITPVSVALAKHRQNLTTTSELLSDLKQRFPHSQPVARNILVGLHAKIAERCEQLFNDGHFDEAVLAAMKAVEEELRTKIQAEPGCCGQDLVSQAMPQKSPPLTFSKIDSEQQAAHFLFRGAIGFIRNPQAHRFIEIDDRQEAIEQLAFASILMRMLDRATVRPPAR